MPLQQYYSSTNLCDSGRESYALTSFGLFIVVDRLRTITLSAGLSYMCAYSMHGVMG